MNKEELVEEIFNKSKIYKHCGRRHYKTVPIAHLVWNIYNPDNKIEKYDGNIVHHINEDYTDDSIENLQKMTRKEHVKHHKLGRKLSEKSRINMSISAIGKFVSKETRKKHSDNTKGKNNPMYGVHRYGKDNPMFGKKQSEESNRKNSEARKEWWRKRKLSLQEVV